MGLAQTIKSEISDVVVWTDCDRRHEWQRQLCRRPRVKVTFKSGRSLIVHDDGSFVQYLGESESGT